MKSYLYSLLFMSPLFVSANDACTYTESDVSKSGRINELASNAGSSVVGFGNNDDADSKALGIDTDVNIYDFDGTGFTLKGATIADAGSGGISFSDDGNIVAVGHHAHNSYAGRAKVYAYNGTAWNGLGGDLTESGSNQMGRYVILSGDGTTLAVSASGTADDANSQAGAVYVYTYDSNNDDWVSKGQPLRGLKAHVNFGGSLDMTPDGTVLAVGAAGFEGYFSVYAFNSGTDQWEARNIVDSRDRHNWDAGTNSPYGSSIHEDGTGTVTEYLGDYQSSSGDSPEYRKTQYTQMGKDIKISDDGNTVFVLEPYGDNKPSTEATGALHIFKWNATQSAYTISDKIGFPVWAALPNYFSITANGKTLAISVHAAYLRHGACPADGCATGMFCGTISRTYDYNDDPPRTATEEKECVETNAGAVFVYNYVEDDDEWFKEHEFVGTKSQIFGAASLVTPNGAYLLVSDPWDFSGDADHKVTVYDGNALCIPPACGVDACNDADALLQRYKELSGDDCDVGAVGGGVCDLDGCTVDDVASIKTKYQDVVTC